MSLINQPHLLDQVKRQASMDRQAAIENALIGLGLIAMTLILLVGGAL